MLFVGKMEAKLNFRKMERQPHIRKIEVNINVLAKGKINSIFLLIGDK